ncbi:MAG: hypothetical protein WB696_29120 [Chthoniobacterales bacterium]
MKSRNLFGVPKVNGIQAYPGIASFLSSNETEIDALHAVVPEPPEAQAPFVKYQFIRMHSFGLGDFTDSGHS